MELPMVKDAMTKGVISCGEDCTVEQVSKLMVEKNVRSIIIENKIGKPVSLVTGGDIVKAMAKKLKPEIPVSEITGKEIITVDADADLLDASARMNSKNIKRLVIMEGGKAVGILTVTDILKYLPRYLQEFASAFNKLDVIIKKL